MCTETFLRLPEEKRNRFLNAAWDEFTCTAFADASINQIVRRAGVPRGSFYQYFAGKEDLFAYLGEIILKHLVAEYRKILTQAEGDLFKAQLLCFDRVAAYGSAADVLFDRSIRILQKNPGILPQTAAKERVLHRLFTEVGEELDVSCLRSDAPAFAEQAFALTLIALAMAVVSCLETPENAGHIRETLVMQLEIIRQGSLADPGREAV